MLAISHFSPDRIRFVHEFHSIRSDLILFSCHPQFWTGCETQGKNCPCFHSLSPTIYIRSRSQPFPFDPNCRPFPTTRISPAKEFIVCIIWAILSSLSDSEQSETGALYPDSIRIPFRYPLCHLCKKVYCCEAFCRIPKMPFKASISPSLLPLMPSLTVTLCFHKGEHFQTMQLFHNCVAEIEPIHQIYPPDTLPLLHWYIATVHPSPQTNKPSLVILSLCIQTGCLAVLAQYSTGFWDI